ncbi:UNVERIFIED_CONTAM: hypothetical protein K2H54_017152 [Gekko kuhli]
MGRLTVCDEFLQSSPVAKQHGFKRPAPRASLLGLNLLATRNHREKECQASGRGGKRYKDSADGKDGPTAAQ